MSIENELITLENISTSFLSTTGQLATLARFVKERRNIVFNERLKERKSENPTETELASVVAVSASMSDAEIIFEDEITLIIPRLIAAEEASKIALDELKPLIKDLYS